jgi:regulation of enolase protein 1 (concanavalin A-like superfamily)
MAVHKLLIACVVTLAMLAFGRHVEAASLTLAWDHSISSGVAGYQISYGTQSGKYTANVKAGYVTSVSINSLTEGTTYYFIVQSYDSAGTLGSPSPEISGKVPAAVPALSISCPSPVLTSPDGNSIAVTLTPTVSGGVAPVSTSCSPASGSKFSVGTTSFSCTAVDAAQQKSSCTSTVVVLAPSQPAPTPEPAPILSSVSPASATTGTQVVLSGSGFGASQGNSVVRLNGVPVTVNAWSNTSITITIPPGATSGPLVVSVAPSMNNSNPLTFTVLTLPAPWLNQDIGSVGVAGSVSHASGVFTVRASGQQIWNTADGLYYVYQPLTGDGTIVARVNTLTGGASTQSAGVMIRETLDANSKHAYVAFSQSQIYFTNRTTTGGSTAAQTLTGKTLPYWVKLTRSGSTFTAAASADGVTWVQVGTPRIINMTASVYVGLTVSSGQNSTLATATFDNVSLTPGVPSTPSSLPTGWLNQDVGSVGVAGSASYTGGIFTARGAGQQIWNTADGLHLAYQSLAGDGTIVARVGSLTGGASTQSAGVMIRETLTANSKHAYVAFSQSQIYFTNRATTGGTTSAQSLIGKTLPYWVKLTRSGSTFTAAASPDGVNWVQVGTPRTITMTGTVYVGLVVSSGQNSTLATAIFDNVSISMP